MTPRRLLPYLLIFLVLAGTYAGLKWHKEKQVAQEEQAKKVFNLTEPEITELSLVRGAGEVRLVKKDKEWYLTAPINTKADQTIVANMLTSLASLRKERDLGVEKDLAPFGLDKPSLVVKFTAQGKPHQLAVGAKVPGDQNYYVLADQDPRLLMIGQGSKDALDRQLLALRDKSLLAFITGEVKGLKIVTGKTPINLEKTGPASWRWVGRPDFKVRGDKVDKLVRDLHLARAKNFLEPPPKNLRALGLVPPQMTEITVVTAAGSQTLWLGAKQGEAAYARKGVGGPIVLVEASLTGDIAKTLSSLEDHRLWSGAITQVHQVVWGQPGKTWTAKKDKESWQITGPDQATTKQPAVRLQMALWNFQKQETVKILPKPGAAGSPAYMAEFLDQAGKPLLHLDEVGPQGKDNLKIVIRVGEKTMTALIPQAPFRQWQEEMNQLTATAKKTVPAQEKGKTPKGGKK
jgi:hypothetical protein